MLWSIYFGPYEIIRSSPVRSWVPGVSREFSKRLVGIMFLSLLVFFILFSIYHSFIDKSPLPLGPIFVLMSYWTVAIGNYFLLRIVKPKQFSVSVKLVSTALYAVLLYLSFTDWNFPFLV